MLEGQYDSNVFFACVPGQHALACRKFPPPALGHAVGPDASVLLFILSALWVFLGLAGMPECSMGWAPLGRL